MYVMTFLQSIPTMNLIEVICYVFVPVGTVICGIVYAWTEAKRRENEREWLRGLDIEGRNQIESWTEEELQSYYNETEDLKQKGE